MVTSVDTSEPSVVPGPPNGDESARPPRGSRRAPVVVTVAGVLVGALVAAGFVSLPYYAIGPGSAYDAARLVTVRDHQAYPPHGEVLLTTVTLGRVNAYEAIQGWLERDVAVVPAHDVLGGTTPRRYEQQNVQAMTDSKQLATYVAMRRLGLTVTVTGDGAQIASLVAAMPAARVLRVGDTITAVDGRTVSIPEDLVKVIRGHRPGDTVHLRVLDAKGVAREVDVVLGQRSDGSALLGVLSAAKNQRIHFPFTVNIDLRQVGGPSGGLAFTLAVLDVLTPGELTGGVPIGVTGTIDLDGNVGPVGGVAQKTATVRRAGAKLFLVPSDEYSEARAHAGKGLRVARADTLDQALAVLATLPGSNAGQFLQQ